MRVANAKTEPSSSRNVSPKSCRLANQLAVFRCPPDCGCVVRNSSLSAAPLTFFGSRGFTSCRRSRRAAGRCRL